MLPNDFFIQYLLKQGLVHPEHLQRAQDIQAQRGGDLIDILFGMPPVNNMDTLIVSIMFSMASPLT